jgi:peptide deformylase
MGHPVLREVARELSSEEIRSPAFQQFCDDLMETMEEYDGVGLAAPQVHAGVRVVIATLDDERGPEFFVNPVIEILGEETTATWEGCLSVEGMRGKVERPSHVLVEALDRDGTPKAFELEGHPAVVIQHECDHLDGVLYIDKVDTRTLSFMREYRRYGPSAEDGDDDAYDELASEELEGEELQGVPTPVE